MLSHVHNNSFPHIHTHGEGQALKVIPGLKVQRKGLEGHRVKMQTIHPNVLTLLGSLTLNGELHTGRLNTCGASTLRQVLRTAQDREIGERRGVRQRNSLQCFPVLA